MKALVIAAAVLSLAATPTFAKCTATSFGVGNGGTTGATLNSQYCPGPVRHTASHTTTQTILLKGKVSDLKIVLVKDKNGNVISRTETVIRH